MNIRLFNHLLETIKTTAQMQDFNLHSSVISATTATRQISSQAKPTRKQECGKESAKPYLLGSSLVGRSSGYTIERGTDAISQRFEGMTPEWHKEHETAFELAQNEAKGHFKRCPRCHKYVCENDWNEQEGLCTEDAPRESTEVAAARAEKMVTDIKQKAENTQVFTGQITSRQTICPQCGKPAGQGKFCNNCGATLSMVICPNVAQKTLQV